MSSENKNIHAIDECEGMYLIKNKVVKDESGHSFSSVKYGNMPEGFKVAQIKQVFTHGGIVRGMHMQTKPQSKMFTCTYGSIWVVVFDLRKHSKTFNTGLGIRLEWSEGESLFVPEGCLTGFLALSQFSVAEIVLSSRIDPKTSVGVSWLSPQIHELFPHIPGIVVDLRDGSLPQLDDYLNQSK